MHKILSATFIAPNIKRFTIEAPKIALKRKAGQFVIIRINDVGERIPLTIADSDSERGTIDIIVQGIGKTTKELNALEPGDFILMLLVPWVKPHTLKILEQQLALVAVLELLLHIRLQLHLKQAGNHTISIIGGRTKEFVILENEMKKVCDEVFVTTDDGSYGKHGFVTDQLKELIETQKNRFCSCHRTNTNDESSCGCYKRKGNTDCCKSKSNYG